MIRRWLRPSPAGIILRRAALAAGVLYGSWLGMLAVHELGHVLHAWLSGGRVERIIFPPLGFSQTIVWPNPHEQFVVWGGPLWGALLPAAGSGIARLFRRRLPDLLKFFAGFCLIANGAYFGFGWMNASGDAADLRALGTPVPLMIAIGAVMLVLGLAFWHRTGWLTRQRARHLKQIAQ